MQVAPSISKVYQDQLTTLSHGLALWNPNPPKEIYDKVSIGDVGYLHEGSFIRMFNVMLPWSHELNRTLGEPEPYELLDCGPFANILKRQFDRVKHCSRYVSSETNAGNMQAMTPDDVEGVTYRFRNCGALLSLPNGGHHEDVIRAQVFEGYIQDYVDSWFTWAQKNRLGVERVEDLILVSGCTLVTSWAAAAFVDDSMDAEISLASRTLNNGGTSFVWSNIRGRVLYENSRLEPFHGEQNFTMTHDQCVFIRGYRVNRRDDKMQVIRVPCVPEFQYDDPNVGVVDTIRPPIKNENPQRSPYRHPALQRNDGSCSSLDINHENPQLRPYPSSTTLHSNGSLYNASFMTSPSYTSSIEIRDYFTKMRHEDASAKDTTNITHDNDLPLVGNVVRSKSAMAASAASFRAPSALPFILPSASEDVKISRGHRLSPRTGLKASNVSTHAEAEALVARARRQVLAAREGDDIPLSARLIALGESLRLERKFKEAKESVKGQDMGRAV